MSAGAVTVRPMESADLEAVLDQIEAIAAEGRWLALEAPVDRDGMRARLADGIGRADALVLVAEVEGEPAGTSACAPSGTVSQPWA